MNTIQFNLIPDVKYDRVQSTKKRNLILRIFFLTTVALVGVFILLLFTAEIVQKKQLSDANKNIAAANKKLAGTPNLSQILTVQNQLNALPNLHSSKHITSRLANYLTVVTPTNVSIGRVSLDLAANTIIIGGTTDSQHSVNVFADTLKFTSFTVGTQAAKKAFSSVVESNFGLTNNLATYELNIQFDPTLFANNLVDSEGRPINPVLKVPTLTTTRAAFDEAGNALFNGQGN